MAREQNPYGYQSPAVSIGASLGRALFGDPAAAQKQAQERAEILLREAQTAQAQAHATLLASQAGGQDIQNGAARSLPDAVSAMFTPRPRTPLPDTLDGFLSDEYPVGGGGGGETDGEAFRRGLPAAISLMGQMQGDKVDPRQIIGTAASFAGDDELARRGLVAQGHTPTKDFALTPERADDIAAQGYTAAERRAVNVAAENHLTDIPIANIRAGASRDVATINNRDDIPVANIRAGAARDVATIGADSRVTVAGVKGANALSSAIVGMYPGAHISRGDGDMASQERFHAQGLTGADWAHTNHNPANGRPAVDMAAIPGKTLSEFVGELQGRGFAVVEAKDEHGGKNDGTGPHWHIAAIPPAGAAKSGVKGPRRVSAADSASVGGEIARLYGKESLLEVDMNGQSKSLLKARAEDIFQQTGNAAAAARQAAQEYSGAVRANGGRLQAWHPGEPIRAATARADARGGPAPVAGAVRAPDGRWVLQRGGQWYEVASDPAPRTRASQPAAPPMPGARQAPDGNWYVRTGANRDGSPRYGRVG